MASASTARASAAGRRSTRATCSWCPQPDTAFLDPFSKIPTLVMICNIQDPITREDYSRDPRNVARKAVNLPEEHRHRRHLLHRPGSRVLHLRRRALRPERPTAATTSSIAKKANGTAAARKAEPGLQAALQGRLLPGAAGRPVDGSPQRDDADDDRLRPGRRGPAPRSGHRRPVRNRPEVRHAGEDGRQHDDVQVHHQERRQEAQQDRHVHAQAAVRRQRLRHAHAHFALEGRQAAVRRQRLRGPERDGPVRDRRPAEARPGHPGVHRARRPTATSGWCRATRRR